MKRVGVFVDAGYFFMRASAALEGKPVSRHGLVFREQLAVDALRQFAEDRSHGSALLRIYWYDGALASSGPSAEHVRLARTDDVKLRLGIINAFGQQKGVDSLIIADMIELARNGAMEDVVLLTGDEDLRVGVQVVQTYGIRVHLLGIVGEEGHAQSETLLREADTVTQWSRDRVSQFLSMRPQTPPSDSPASAARMMEPIATDLPSLVEANDVAQVVRATCAQFAHAMSEIDIEDVRTVFESVKQIPKHVDGRLLASTRNAVGRKLEPEETRMMRRFFLEIIEANYSEPTRTDSSENAAPD